METQRFLSGVRAPLPKVFALFKGVLAPNVIKLPRTYANPYPLSLGVEVRVDAQRYRWFSSHSSISSIERSTSNIESSTSITSSNNERKVSHSGTSSCYHYSRRRLAYLERLCTLIFNLCHKSKAFWIRWHPGDRRLSREALRGPRIHQDSRALSLFHNENREDTDCGWSAVK